jgi:hypothetical protein
LLDDFQFYDVCPKFIKNYFDEDASGVTTPRPVAIPKKKETTLHVIIIEMKN